MHLLLLRHFFRFDIVIYIGTFFNYEYSKKMGCAPGIR